MYFYLFDAFIQIKVLEVEKLSSEQNLESVVDFAKKQNTFAAKKCDEVTMF